MENGFDNELYLRIQREKILERINKFNDKLYLEFGGKLFDDYHASRVLRGFKSNSKLKVLLSLKDESELVFVINSYDIDNKKVRKDNNITYQSEVERLIDAYKESGLFVSSVVFSFYHDSTSVKQFMNKLKKNGINVYKHYQIDGYPNNVSKVLSNEGFGKNDYIKTIKRLVIVTAPGPGSGKMAVCLSNIYKDSLNKLHSGYAKYETFPVWNLSLNHPLNIAYEAATVDLNDVNMIDPYHLDCYGKVATNYNRDIETFPLLKAIFDNLYGVSPYNSPTDMGVNMAGFAIVNDEIVCNDSKQEVIRRYYETTKQNYLGIESDEAVTKIEALMQKLDITINDRKCVRPCLEKAKKENVPVCSIELSNGPIITGKQSELLSASSAMLLNALKEIINLNDSIKLLSKEVIEQVKNLKINHLGKHHYNLNIDEVLFAFSIQSINNELSKLCLDNLDKFKGLEMHSSVLLSDKELNTLKKLEIRVSEEPISFARKLYIK